MEIFEQAQQAAAHGWQKSLDRDALRFLAALDQGDFDMLIEIYERAAHDPELAQLLDGVRDEWLKEEGATLSPEEAQQVRLMVWKALHNDQEGEEHHS
jgi:hypothetical protein